MDLDITSSKVASGILNMVKGHSRTLSIDLSFGLLSSREDTASPETLIGGVRLHHVDLSTVQRISSQPLQSPTARATASSSSSSSISRKRGTGSPAIKSKAAHNTTPSTSGLSPKSPSTTSSSSSEQKLINEVEDTLNLEPQEVLRQVRWGGWRAAEWKMLKLRSISYLVDKIKSPAGEPFFNLVGHHMLLATRTQHTQQEEVVDTVACVADGAQHVKSSVTTTL